MTHLDHQLTIESCSMPMWTTEPDGTVNYVNPAWQAYSGILDETKLNDNWTQAIHPDDDALFRERWSKATSEAECWDIEYRFRRADGTYRWHFARLAPLSITGGILKGWMGTAIDIDDRWRREAALRASEGRYRDIIETAGDIVYALSLDGTLTAVNPAIEHTLGYSPEELLGRSIEEAVLPHDQVAIARQAKQRQLKGEEIGAFELEVMSKSGRRVTLEINSRLAIAYGVPVGIHGIARDVTARKQAQVGLARLAAIVEDSDDAIISRTLDGTITSWNRGAERLYGYTAEEIVGKSVTCLAPPGRPYEIDQLTRRLSLRERIPHFETVRLRKDGTLVDVSISLSPLTDGTGHLIGVSTIARDITARMQTEARLRLLAEAGSLLASELNVDAQLNALAHLVVPTLADWCVVDLADSGSDLRRVAVAHVDPAKLSLAEEVRRRYPPEPNAPRGPHYVMRTGQSDMMPEIPDSLLVATAKDAEHLRLLRDVGLRSYLTVPLHARGRILGTLTFVAAESGHSYGMDDLAVAEALAELAALAIDNAKLYRSAQEAEASYRKVFTGVADAIVVANPERQYVDVNPAATELLGYSRNELLSMSVEDILVNDESWTEEEYARFLAEGRWQGEFVLHRKDGTTVPVEALATVVDLPAGPVHLAALRDVSERHRLERLRRDFLAMVTHDLRTPLTTIKGSAQMLQRRNEYRAAQVEAVLTSTAKMQQLIDDLADAVLLEAGHVTLRKQSIDLSLLVDDVAKDLQAAFEGCQMRIVFPQHPVVGAWDEGRLKQVLSNLVENAFKYGSKEFEVVIRVEDDEEEARVIVADRGPGIAAEQLPQLFDRFYRADTTGVGGLGLGLYISRMLIEAHGGRIWVDSEVGEGSTFTFALPKRT